jgi:hypothetical protein
VQTTDRLNRPSDVDRCECEDLGSLVLVDVSTRNPIHCGSCRGEIDPNRLHLTEEETQAIGGWFSVASALNRLWLDSRQYEEYAKIQLSDPQGQVNVAGSKSPERYPRSGPHACGSSMTVTTKSRRNVRFVAGNSIEMSRGERAAAIDAAFRCELGLGFV